MLCIHWHEALASTNDEAIRLAKEGAPEGSVVWAERQTAGRGRRGHAWESPKGNLYVSVIVRPDLPLAQAGRIGVAAGLMIVRATWDLLRSKWPNDLYHDGRKAGGILVETRAGEAGKVEWAVIGVGLNVVSHPEVEPSARPATHLPAGALGSDLAAFVETLARILVNASTLVTRDDWWHACQTVFWPRFDLTNGPVRVLTRGEAFEAVGVGLDEDGALLVRVGEGREVRRVTAGEVSVRPRDGR